MKKELIKKIWAISFLTFSSTSAWASCNLVQQPNIVIAPGQLLVPRATPVGTIFATLIQPGNKTDTYTCTNISQPVATTILYQNSSPLGGNVYSTNVPGVGVKISANSNNGFYYYPIKYSPTPARINAHYYIDGKLEFVKTGPIQNGVLDGGVVLQNIVTENGGSPVLIDTIIFQSTPITVVGCSIMQSSIPVKLGDNMYNNQFNGPGSTSDDVSFTVPLECDVDTRVSYQIDGSSGIGDGVIALSNEAGAATGLGVQITHDGTPITVGKPNFVGVVNTAGNFNIDFKAHYLQTAQSVTGGPANANATFTITYD